MPPQNIDSSDKNVDQSAKPFDADKDCLEFGRFLSHPAEGEDIVITGLAGDFPNSDSVYEFGENLFNKADLVTEDHRRWNITHQEIPARSGKVNKIDKMDAAYFGLPSRLAHMCDPLVRLLLERTVEAIMDAGINPKDFEGTKTNVYVGACFSEAERDWFDGIGIKEYHSYGVTGVLRSLIANRLSYHLKLKGYSFICDTACSSSMYALEQAYRDLRTGICDTAIVSGANACLHPYVSLQFFRLGVLSLDGTCKVFDESGNGYARSEAICSILLQKSKVAKRIYARVIHIKTNCDGYKEQGITFPSSEMQRSLLKEFYKECQVDPNRLSYVEAHGTGTKVGDPEEVLAIDEAICKKRKKPVLVGSVKSNIGHTEPSSALCALVKCIYAFETGYIPPNLHYKTPRAGMKGLEEGRLEVVTEKTPFRDDNGLIAINSFGFGGGNAHLLLEWNKKRKVNKGLPEDDLPRLVCVSGRTDKTINCLFNELQTNFDKDYVKLLHSLFSSAHPLNLHRGFAIVSKSGLIKQNVRKYTDHKKVKFYLIFGNFNQNWCKFAAELNKIPICLPVLQSITSILEKKKINIKSILSNSTQIRQNLRDYILGNFVMQIIFVHILKEIGITPDQVFGISLGEFISAYYDETLTLEQVLDIALFVTSNISEQPSCTFVVFQSYDELKKVLPKNISIAKTSSQSEVLISGDIGSMAQFTCGLQKKGIKVFEVGSGLLNLDNGKQNELHQQLTKIILKPKTWSKLVCRNGANLASADYFINVLTKNTSIINLMNCNTKNAIFLEIGSGQLGSIIKQFSDNVNIFNICSGNEITFTNFLETLGIIYLYGQDMHLDKIYPQIDFPVSRGTTMLQQHIRWQHSKDWYYFKYDVNKQKCKEGEKRVTILYREKIWCYLMDHIIDGRNLYPAMGYLYMVWSAFSQFEGYLCMDLDVVFENCRFKRATNIPNETIIDFLVMIQRRTGQFEVINGGSVVVSGRIYKLSDDNNNLNIPVLSSTVKNPTYTMNNKDIYKELRLRGYHYKGLFKNLQQYNIDTGEGLIKWENNWTTFLDNMLQVKILQEDSRLLYVPTFIGKMIVRSEEHKLLMEELGPNPNVPIYINKESDILKCGGVEIHRVGATSIQKKKDLGEPVLEKYEFVPNVGTLSIEQALRVNIQIALENTWSMKSKGVELIDTATDPELEPLSLLMMEILGDLPLIQPDLTILSKTPIENYPVKMEDKKLLGETDCSFVMGSKFLSRIVVLQQALGAVKDNGYILSRESLEFDMKSVETGGLNIITCFKTNKETLVFFNKLKDYVKPNFVNVNDKNQEFKFLKDLQNAIQRDTNSVLYSYNEPLNGILGFTNCIRREPGGQNTKCFFIIDKSAPEFNESNEFYKEQLQKNLAINVYKNGKWGTYRHLLLDKVTEVESEHAYANNIERGDMSSFKWLEGPLKMNTKTEVEHELCHVYYSALNFRDIMLVTGRINPDVVTRDRLQQMLVQGMEFSGRDSKGNRIMGMIQSGSLATIASPNAQLIWKVPDEWSMEEAATVPVVYGTCIFALVNRGKIKKGESILIHSGTGGIGLAAIQVALYYGAVIYTTVGSPDKKEFLKKVFPQIKDSHIGNSRDLSFEKMVYQQTSGRGVDIVLNSLAEEKLLASVRCLGVGGRFLEIGKFDLAMNNELNLLLLKKKASFHGIMLDDMFKLGPAEMSQYSEQFVKALHCGAIKPLPRTVFKNSEIEQAFRHMATGKHTGKILIKIRDEEKDHCVIPKSCLLKCTPRYYCDPSKVYIIIGGLGGFGLELADWLILRGAKNLVLTSRVGIRTGYQASRINVWQSYGTNIVISNKNVITQKGCEELIEESLKIGRIDAIFNLAVVLKDALLENQTEETFRESIEPKAVATMLLDEVTRKLCPDLKDFVVFSSVSCGRGNAGQTNYGMGNSIMERICEKRFNDGYPALAIQWGAIGDVGLVAETQESSVQLEIGGTLQQRITNCLNVMDIFLKQRNSPVVASMVVAEKRARSGNSDNIVDAVAYILGIKDMKSISMHATLAELGMDSITAVEIKQTLEREFDVYLTAQEIRNLTFARLEEIQEEKDSHGNEKTRAIGGIKMLLRLLGDEKTINIPSMKLKSRILPSQEAPTVILLPGIEGVASSLTPLTENLNCHALGIQLTYLDQKDTIIDMAKDLFSEIIKHVSKEEPFVLVSYSYGVILGLEVIAMLELEGYECQIVCIDGAPDLFGELLQMIEVESEDRFQTGLMCKALALHVNHDTVEQHKEAIFKCNSLDERIKLSQKIVKESKEAIHSPEHQKQMGLAIYKRIKALQTYKPSYSLLKSKLTLFKAKYSSLKTMKADFSLGNYSAEGKIPVYTLEANHVSILEDIELADFINAAVGVETIRSPKSEDSDDDIGQLDEGTSKKPEKKFMIC